LVINFVVQLQAFVKERIVIVLNSLSLLYFGNCIPANDVWIRCSRLICCWQTSAKINVGSYFQRVGPFRDFFAPYLFL
jgi:hypothetical protein